MSVCLAIVFILTLLGGIVMLVTATGAVQEIEGLLMLLISAMCFCTVAILAKLNKALPPPRPPLQEGTPAPPAPRLD